LKSFGKSVNEDKTAHVLRIGARIEPSDQTAIRVRDKYVGPRLTSGG
jgi:hypothetical protein